MCSVQTIYLSRMKCIHVATSSKVTLCYIACNISVLPLFTMSVKYITVDKNYQFNIKLL